jgi:hypothetical protein
MSRLQVWIGARCQGVLDMLLVLLGFAAQSQPDPNAFGLDEYDVHNARGWDRYMILALPSVVRGASLPLPNPKKGRGTGKLGGVPTGPHLAAG